MAKTMKISSGILSLLEGKNLSEREAFEFFSRMFKQPEDLAPNKAALLLLAKKGESSSELVGGIRALRKLEPAKRLRINPLMDTCGTGGDQSHSINVSTLAAFVIAGAGVKVAKHGNRALSSKFGSSDLMEALGVRLDASFKTMAGAIQKCGMGYFHAPSHHPVFSKMQPLRRRLKTRTIFNWMGPLVNPAAVNCQLIGVAKKEMLPLYAETLRRLGFNRAAVCHSLDGMDELSTASPSQVAFINKGKVAFKRIDPRRFGFKPADRKMFQISSPRVNKSTVLKLLQGKLRGPKRDLVVFNAAMGLVVAGKCKNLKKGILLASKSLDTGRAYQVLVSLKKLSRSGK